jgi:HK97 family phage prohead protease
MRDIMHTTNERRISAGSIELRESPTGGTTLDVLFAPFNSPATIFDGIGPDGYFIESYGSRSYDSADLSRTVAIVGHDKSAIPFGSVASGTMTIRKTPEGMRFSVPLDLSIPNHQNIAGAVRRGDLSGSSACFTVAADSWSVGSDGVEVREITRIASVPEISLTSFPAYTATTTLLRSLADQPDGIVRLTRLYNKVVKETREGKTISAATAEQIKQALAHLTSGSQEHAAASQVLQDLIPGDGTQGGNNGPGSAGGGGLTGGDGSGSRAATRARLQTTLLRMRDDVVRSIRENLELEEDDAAEATRRRLERNLIRMQRDQVISRKQPVRRDRPGVQERV